ncbi:MAG: putative esterase [Flavobacteriales bacterium]|jgi:predicted esterase
MKGGASPVGGGGAVFERGCQAALTCSPILDLSSGDIYNHDGPCVSDGDCREGESCLFSPLTDIDFGALATSAADSYRSFTPRGAPMRDVSLALSIALCGAAFSLGCDELDAAINDADAVGEVDAGADATDDVGPVTDYDDRVAVAARFDANGESFYDLPWPSDLRTNADGTLDLTTFPDAGGVLVQAYLAELNGRLRGYSLMPVLYAGFAASLPEDELPSPADSLAPSATVQLIRLGDGCAERVPIEVSFRAEGDNYFEENLVIAVPVPGFVLAPGEPYAFVVLRSLGESRGESAAPTDELATGLAGDGVLAPHLAPLADCLPTAGLRNGDIASAAVFTTQSPEIELRALRDAVRNPSLEAPDVSAWEESSLSGIGGRAVFTGRYNTPIYQEGTSPFANEGGSIEFGSDGVPELQNWESVPFTVTWRTNQEGPRELLLWSDGTGASQLGFLSSTVTEALLAEGFLIASFVPQFHDTRATPGADDEIHSFNLINPAAFRNVFRQQVADTSYFLRLFLEERAQLPGLPDLDASRVVYGGHSQGALVGAMVAGVEGDIDTFAFNGIAGTLSLTALERTDPIDFAAVIGALADIRGAFDRTHPVLAMVQLGADLSDTHAFAPHWRGWDANPDGANVLLTNGIDDTTAPVRAMSAVAIAGDVTIAEPVGWDVDPFGVWDGASQALPISENVSALDGTPRTHAAYLSDRTGHFTIYQRSDVRELFARFLATGTLE